MVTTFFKAMRDDTSGATAVEYGLIVALIVLAMLGSLRLVVDETIEMWQYVEDSIVAVMSA